MNQFVHMKRRVFEYAFLLILFSVFVGCQQQKKSGEEKASFAEAITAQDTAAVEELVGQFFTHAINKEFSEAAAMLYRSDKDIEAAPEPLTNEEMAEVISMLETISMVDYKIESIKFQEYYMNEVSCRVIICKGEGDMPDITTKVSFKPVNYLGNWVLCLMNSQYGDRGL